MRAEKSRLTLAQFVVTPMQNDAMDRCDNTHRNRTDEKVSMMDGKDKKQEGECLSQGLLPNGAT